MTKIAIYIYYYILINIIIEYNEKNIMRKDTIIINGYQNEEKIKRKT